MCLFLCARQPQNIVYNNVDTPIGHFEEYPKVTVLDSSIGGC